VVTRTGGIYGRVEGSVLLVSLAYPDGPGPRAAHFGSRRFVAGGKVGGWGRSY
jgi:hypothetical protein